MVTAANHHRKITLSIPSYKHKAKEPDFDPHVSTVKCPNILFPTGVMSKKTGQEARHSNNNFWDGAGRDQVDSGLIPPVLRQAK